MNEHSFEEILKEGIAGHQFGGSIEAHGTNAVGFFRFPSFEAKRAYNVVDIGSGAGLPSLILAVHHPKTRWLLIERRSSRVELLQRACRRLGLLERVEVLDSDVYDVAHSPRRGSFDLLTSRSFGPPSSTAEYASALLVPGGLCLVSEPSSTEDRWPDAGLTACGLIPRHRWDYEGNRYVALERTNTALSALPRRSITKRPLF